MKASTSLLIFFFFLLKCTSGIASASDSSFTEISHTHNRLYFTRLHEKDLPDSVIRRNIDKAEVALKTSKGDAQDGSALLIEKSQSEIFYLKGLLAIRRKDVKMAMIMLDSAASWKTVIKDQDIPPSLADLTFISSGSVFRYRSSIRTLRRNVLIMMIEDVYKKRNDQPETATIEKIKILKAELNREIPGTGVYLDDSVERMYAYLMLNYNSKHKICEEVMQYYNMLVTNEYGYSDVPHLSPVSGLTGNQLSQRTVEMRVAPQDYYMIEQPSNDDINRALKLAKAKCPRLFKNNKVFALSEVDSVGKMYQSRPSMLVLPKIPFTKSAWNKIPVNVDVYKNLGDLESFLENKLRARGYENVRYYGFEDGFAIITPIEKFNMDGKLYEGKGRFSMNMNTSINSFFDYIDKLFLAQKGHYRFIILAAASNQYSLGKRPTLDYMEALVAKGENRLSEEVAQKPLNKLFSVDGYVYEFEQNEFASDPIFVKEPALTGKEHIAPLINF